MSVLEAVPACEAPFLSKSPFLLGLEGVSAPFPPPSLPLPGRRPLAAPSSRPAASSWPRLITVAVFVFSSEEC